MFRCKRDVDRHVADLEEKVPSVAERSLKYFTVARLYFNVGEDKLALKFLDKYCDVRPSSAPAFKFRGQVLEKAAEREQSQESSQAKKTAALEAFQSSYQLDLSQKELLLKVCELLLQFPIADIERTRYWIEQSEKQFPRNKLVTKLREKMRSVSNKDEGLNGNGQISTEDSPNSHTGAEDEVEADNSILWSTSRLGNSFALNGSYRVEDALNSTPGRSNNPGRRFPPRPSPERLANQMRQIESAQEKMSAAVLDNSRALLETQEAILGELRKTREDVARNMRENTEAVRDLRSEMGSLWREMREEIRRNANKKQEVIVVNQPEPAPRPPPAAAPGPSNPPPPATPQQKSITVQDLQEVIAQANAQQAAMYQMQSLSMAGMLASAVRPPAPVPPPPHAAMPHLFQAHLPGAQPPLPQHPVAVTTTVNSQQQAVRNNTPVNVVITSSDKIPTAGPTASLPAVAIPPQHRLGTKPQTTTPTFAAIETSVSSPHNYQINIGNNKSATESPFNDKEDGPAVPISTSSILANIPAPVISAVAKTPPAPTKTASTPKQPQATPKSTALAPAPSMMDKFKPKAGSWECPGCFLRQDANLIQCPVCQTAKPGHEEEVKAKEEAAKPKPSFGASGGFKFGGTPNNNATSTTSLGGFNFGNAPTSTPTTTAKSEAEPAKPSPFQGFSFGSGGGASSAGGFSFSGIQSVGASTTAATASPAPTGFSLNTSKSEDQTQEGHDESHDDSNAHDPHFEPIIAMPDLVSVTTGEEEEEAKFTHRAKVFRFDKDTKEWKERGLGDFKILYHPKKHTYRLLLRRELVHKIACNHYITTDMELVPMAKSETALTWFTCNDFSEEGESRPEKLAVKFKLAETKEEFKKVFEEAQEDLKTRPAASGENTENEEASNPPSGGDDNSSGELSFEGQGLKLNNAGDAKDVVAKINSTKNFKTLTFSGNTVGIEAAEAIGKALENHPEMQYAHWKDMFTGRMKTEIPPALKHLSNGLLKAAAKLVELDLSDNAFGPIGMDGIVDLLKSPSCFTLKELRLNNTGCGVTGGKLLAKTLMEAYTASKGQFTLKVFVLGRSRQENEGAIALAGVFKAMKSLEEVVMPQNGIYFEGITALSDAFANNPNLKILNMNDNTFTEKGAKALAAALPKMKKLEVLDLGDCLLKTEGARQIAYALKEGHATLREWHMSSNEIRLAGGFAILDAVANKTNLEKLSIDTNQFGAEGCGRLMKKLETIGKKHLMEDIEDDEEPDDEDEEEGENNDDANATKENVEQVSSFSFYTPSSGNKTATSSLFGGSAEAKPATEPSASPSIFSGLKLGGSSNLFGGSTGASSTTPSIFGASGQTGETGNAAPNIFGQSPAFGGNATGSIFGTAKTEASTDGIFGTPKATDSTTKGIDLSASKDLPTFSSIGGSGGFAFGSGKGEGFSFQGAGTSLFGSGSKAGLVKTNTSQNNDDGDNATEDPDHDPHFEPIIPLPELVNVQTGEEDEQVLFKHRAKVFRFDKDTKQWKERGVGDIKILHHTKRVTFRLLLRRDQIHKIACNHLISVDMKLEPMASSETALTWFAMDFAEDEANGQLEKLAVRFKLAETKDEFKKIFEECQEKLKNKPATPAKNSEDAAGAEEDEDGDYEDEETADDDQSDDSDNTMFERVCDLKEIIGEKGIEVSLGTVVLKILYDEDVYGARISALKVTPDGNDDEVYLCNHLIAIQTNVEVDETNRRCIWSGLDFSVDPPRYRKFVAIFPEPESDGEDAQMEFVAVFQEGKDLAEQSEILEQPLAGDSLNPAELYYGQGAEYDDE